MKNNYRELNTVLLQESDQVARPSQYSELTLDSPAIKVVTDFSEVQPLTMELNVTVDDAREMMRKVHVRSVLVVDSNQNFKGLVTIADLESRAVMSVATTAGVSRSEVTIRDVMTGRSRLRAIPFSQIASANIGDVLETLKNEGAPHILVVDSQNQTIRGVISSSDIARKLNVSVDINKRASSFQEVVGIFAAGQDM